LKGLSNEEKRRISILGIYFRLAGWSDTQFLHSFALEVVSE